ncbi:MAG: type I glyceraldehyde-3-phosphate dehydrogenase [Mailhella sp.]|nr:type I glyceraldehyde-3-phosphate dehydrogenase [Mailhella sp.]
MIKIGINGFGRIGRYLLRVMDLFPQCEVVVINGHRASNSDMAYLLKYDSVHGRFPGKVVATENGLSIDGREIAITRCNKGEWKWADYGVDIVVETSGTLKTRELLAEHIACGAKKVIMSAPCKDADCTIVMGVNDSVYDSAVHDVISAASCTTNCLAPAVKVLNDKFGIKHGLMTTIHSYTMSQRLLDGTQKDLRRGRAACLSIIPTSTGAAKAVGLVIPELNGLLNGGSLRVPTPDVSLVDFTCELKREVTVEEVNAALKDASETWLRDNLGYCDEPLVSIDYVGDTHGGTVDASFTAVMNKTMLKTVIWYDNESGFTHQLARLISKVADAL